MNIKGPTTYALPEGARLDRIEFIFGSDLIALTHVGQFGWRGAVHRDGDCTLSPGNLATYESALTWAMEEVAR